MKYKQNIKLCSKNFVSFQILKLAYGNYNATTEYSGLQRNFVFLSYNQRQKTFQTAFLFHGLGKETF